MAKNNMEEVAKLLGVEMGEEFYVTECDTKRRKFRMTSNGLMGKYDNGKWYPCPDVMHRLLLGAYEVEFLPWKAKPGEAFYYPRFDPWEYVYTANRGNDKRREVLFHTGMMCRTEKQALELGRILEATARKYQGFED